MVHKKSEYTLQFHILPSDLRKKIWEENIRFREFRRSVNRADHFWSYQLIDKCDCESDNEVVDLMKDVNTGFKCGDSTATCMTPNTDNVSTTKQNKENLSENYKAIFKNIGVQTTELPDSVHLEKHSNTEKHHSKTSREQKPEQTENKHTKALKKFDAVCAGSIPAFPEKSKSPQVLKESQISPAKKGFLRGAKCVRPSSAKELRSSSVVQLHPKSIRQMHTSSASMLRPSSVCGKTSSTSTFRRPRSPSPRFSILSRTSRRSFMEQPRSTFAAYGWNDTQKKCW